MRPRVVLKAATSLNGVLDDSSTERLMLSSPEDAAAVDELRASCDAILVGAETVRQDNPRLKIRDEARIAARLKSGRSAQPLKVTITRSGRLPADAAIFEGPPPLVYAPAECDLPENSKRVSTAVSLPEVLVDLRRRGVEILLVEGGSTLLAQFLELSLFDEFRLAIAPRAVFDARAVRLQSSPLQNLRLIGTEMLGQMTVLHLVP